MNTCVKGVCFEPGCEGLGFAVANEKLPKLFASLGAQITGTDGPVGGDWEAGGVYASNKEQLFHADMIDRSSILR
jgi:hypothetical protein